MGGPLSGGETRRRSGVAPRFGAAIEGRAQRGAHRRGGRRGRVGGGRAAGGNSAGGGVSDGSPPDRRGRRRAPGRAGGGPPNGVAGASAPKWDCGRSKTLGGSAALGAGPEDRLDVLLRDPGLRRAARVNRSIAAFTSRAMPPNLPGKAPSLSFWISCRAQPLDLVRAGARAGPRSLGAAGTGPPPASRPAHRPGLSRGSCSGADHRRSWSRAGPADRTRPTSCPPARSSRFARRPGRRTAPPPPAAGRPPTLIGIGRVRFASAISAPCCSTSSVRLASSGSRHGRALHLPSQQDCDVDAEIFFGISARRLPVSAAT